MNPVNAWRGLNGLQRLHAFIIVLAVITAIPAVIVSYGRVAQVHEQARARLITLHRLWELHPEYKGRPEAWTRFATRLLTDNQLLRRINSKYGALAEEIERDYRRDLAIADAEVILGIFLLWALPLAAIYTALRIYMHRRSARLPNETQTRPSTTDPRYLPRTDTSGETQ